MASRIIKRFMGLESFLIRPSNVVHINDATIHQYIDKTLWVKGTQVSPSGLIIDVQAELILIDTPKKCSEKN